MADSKDERIDQLLKKLTDKNEDSQTREMAAYSLGEIGDPRTVEPLINTLKDDDWNVRWVTTHSLGLIGDKRAVEPLIKALGDNNEDWEVRRKAAVALGEIGDKQAVEPLIKTLEDENKHIRWEAAKALGLIGDSRTAEPLLVALANDEDEDVRRQTTVALGQIPLTATACQEMNLIPLLLTNVLTSKDEDVKDISKQLLKKCRGLE